MRLDVWKNPVVVSAMRIKYRKGSPRLMLAMYVAAMLVLGALLHRYADLNRFPFASTYLLIVLSVQFLLSGAMALFGAARSIASEVVNQTLDFQRIVSLSPRTILIGKMLGEPASSYLMALATVPLSVFCWAMGGATGSFLLCAYVNLATWTLMCAAIGLIHPLTAPTQRVGRQRGGIGGLFFLVFIFLPQMIVQGVGMLDVPGIGELIQLLTPLGWLLMFHQGDAWSACVSLWGLSVPSLLAAPVSQICVTGVILSGMARRLRNSNDPPLRKLQGYALLVAVDLVIAGACFARWLEGFDALHLTYCFFLAHYVVSVALAFAMTPGQTALSSWAWRHSGQRPNLRDRFVGDRYDICTASFVVSLLGGVVYVGSFAAPVAAYAAPNQIVASTQQIAESAAATTAFIVSAAVAHQLFSVAVRKGGRLLFIFFLFFVNAAPPTVAAVFEAWQPRFDPAVKDALISVSPIGFYVENLSRVSGNSLSPAWTLAVHTVLAAVGMFFLRRWMHRESVSVARKLRWMGVD